MEQWQIKAITDILNSDADGVSTSVHVTEQRVYLHSPYSEDTRYHIVSRSNDGNVAIDQIDVSESRLQRVTMDGLEIWPLLRVLLLWELQCYKRENGI